MRRTTRYVFTVPGRIIAKTGVSECAKRVSKSMVTPNGLRDVSVKYTAKSEIFRDAVARVEVRKPYSGGWAISKVKGMNKLYIRSWCSGSNFE